MPDMKYTGLRLTERFEGCSLEAYPDPKWHGVPRTPENNAEWGDPWTIGDGYTGPEVHEGLVWTQAQADAHLLSRLQGAADAVNRLVKVVLTQGEFNALVDLVYNIGAEAFAESTLLRLLNAGDYAGACAEIDKWDHAGGKVLAGLLRRRQAETAEFEEGMKEN